ncbi:hypothetical protein [Sinomonas humi]|uniref:hypothetical protein n=1 Tax=Sinomonas humi TaxID=1338436 RepID=UPI0012E09936|nr:hypothetical protein [Sinomonas humi]
MKRRSPRTATGLVARISTQLDDTSSDLSAQAAGDELHGLLIRELDVAAILADFL